MPDTVKNFIKFFYDKVRARSLFEIQDVYETTWHKLTERYPTNVHDIACDHSPTTGAGSTRTTHGLQQRQSSHSATVMRSS